MYMQERQRYLMAEGDLKVMRDKGLLDSVHCRRSPGHVAATENKNKLINKCLSALRIRLGLDPAPDLWIHASD